MAGKVQVATAVCSVILTHRKQHVCLWSHYRETGALQGLASKQHKKELFYQSRYCEVLGFFTTNKLEGLLGTLLITMHPHTGEQLPSLCSTDRGAYLILAHYSASLIFLHSLASLHTISSA